MSNAEEKSAAPAVEDKSFADILRGLVGQVVTVATPESFEETLVGQQLGTGFYRAKVTGLGRDYLVLMTEMKRKGKESAKEPVRQFLPLSSIKRLSVLKSDRYIHI